MNKKEKTDVSLHYFGLEHNFKFENVQARDTDTLLTTV